MRKLEKRLKRKVMAQLRVLGFAVSSRGQIEPPELSTKDTIRRIHSLQRIERIKSEQNWIRTNAKRLVAHFASSEEVQPKRICPVVEEVITGQESGDLFRFASLLWSVPVSKGYGRRLRFLVRDDANGKLIGLIGLGDPVFNLRKRDEWIGWDVRGREKRLCNIMDAFVLGAVQPYSTILGGKLVAALVASKEINERFQEKYSGRVGIISEKRRVARLVLITTTSSLGRSSVYNRLKVNGSLLFQPLGYTQGFGHFQFPQKTFDLMVEILKERDHPYVDPELQGNRYGGGPNWRFRVIRAALDQIGLRQELLQHGIAREVYGIPLATNWREFLVGHEKKAIFNLLTVRQISDYCLSRWIVPRAERNGFDRNFDPETLIESFSRTA